MEKFKTPKFFTFYPNLISLLAWSPVTRRLTLRTNCWQQWEWRWRALVHWTWCTWEQLMCYLSPAQGGKGQWHFWTVSKRFSSSSKERFPKQESGNFVCVYSGVYSTHTYLVKTFGPIPKLFRIILLQQFFFFGVKKLSKYHIGPTTQSKAALCTS